jgi:hypothetical protein
MLQRETGDEAKGLQLAQAATVDLLMSGMDEPASEDDWKLIKLFLDVGLAFLELAQGNKPTLFEPKVRGSGNRPMTTAEVGYRAWAARASMALIHTGKAAGVADQLVAEATAWIDDDPAMAARLGGALTKNAVRNARLTAEANGNDPIAQFARGIPSFIEAGRTAELQAAWFVAQLAKKGQAY